MSKPMTKTQLIAALAEDMGSDKKAAAASLDAICNLITREVFRWRCGHVARYWQNHVPRASRAYGA